MIDKLKVQYPRTYVKPEDAVPCYGEQHFFAAYGKTPPDCNEVHAILVDEKGKIICEGKTVLCNGEDWSVSFTKPAIEFAEGKAKGLVKVRVEAQGQPPAEVNGVMLVVGDKRMINIPISSPLANSTVCSTFDAYGTTAGTNPITGTMNTTTGTTLQGAPNWIVHFASLPNGTYTFAVTDGSGGSGSSSPVYVRSTQCA